MRKKLIYLLILSIAFSSSFVRCEKVNSASVVAGGLTLGELLVDLCLSVAASYLTYDVLYGDDHDVDDIISAQVYNYLADDSTARQLEEEQVAWDCVQDFNNVVKFPNGNDNEPNGKYLGLYITSEVYKIVNDVLTSKNVVDKIDSLQRGEYESIPFRKLYNDSYLNIFTPYANGVLYNSTEFYKICSELDPYFSSLKSEVAVLADSVVDPVLVLNYDYVYSNSKDHWMTHEFIFVKSGVYDKLIFVCNSDKKYNLNGLNFDSVNGNIMISADNLPAFGNCDKEYYYGRIRYVYDRDGKLDRVDCDTDTIDGYYDTFSGIQYYRTSSDHVKEYNIAYNNDYDIYFRQNYAGDKFCYRYNHFNNTVEEFQDNEFVPCITPVPQDSSEIFVNKKDSSDLEKDYKSTVTDTSSKISPKIRDDEYANTSLQDIPDSVLIEIPYFDADTLHNTIPEQLNDVHNDMDIDDHVAASGNLITENINQTYVGYNSMINPIPDGFVQPDPLPDPEPAEPLPGDDDILNGDTVSDYPLASDLTDIFPFCLPFDLYEIIQTMDAPAKAPVWEIPILISSQNEQVEYITVDLSSWDEVARIFRIFIFVAFCVGLIYATGRIMGGGRS